MTKPRYRKDLTAEYVRSLLDYDPDTGILTWKVRRGGRGKIGREAGCIYTADGRRAIGIDGHIYQAYRLAWLIMTGDWPTEQIDHKYGDPGDNRWENIRAATHSQNLANQRIRKTNKSGIKGVYRRKDCRRWTAFIHVNGQTRYLGLFKTKEEAAATYQQAAKQYFGDFAHY